MSSHSARGGIAVLLLGIALLLGGAADSGSPAKGARTNGFPEVGAQKFLDDGRAPGTAALWGSVDCATPNRVRVFRQGGEPRRRANGRRQAGGFRRIVVRDGDDVYGERCEIGRNDHRVSPTVLYHQGDHTITFISYRLGPDFPLRRQKWQALMQMKQAQPSDGGGGNPVLAIEASDGFWRLGYTPPSGVSVKGGVWTAPARKKIWVRFAFDVVYSTDPQQGSIKVYADLNGDGDARDRGERSPRLHLATLKTETAGGVDDGLAQGDAIPSGLRVGIYHDPDYVCAERRCAIDIDNVGVYSAP